MDGEVAPDEPALTPQGAWTRNTFFVVLDQVISSMRNRFGKNETLLSAYHLFSTQNFKSITDSCNSTDEIRGEPLPFCNRYAINVTRCGMELINFARVYETFWGHVGKEIEQDESTDVDFGLETHDEINDDFEDAGDVSAGQSNIGYGMLSVPKRSSILDVLKLLLDTKFHLIDAYPELSKVYSIAVAIPVTSATAERSFSALKRIKSRLRSTMAQDRLEGLLLLSLERKICISPEKTMLIDSFARTSSELCKALLG